MKNMKKIILTAFIAVIAGTSIWAISTQTVPRNEDENLGKIEIVMHKNEACECCTRWADYLEKQGYRVSVQVTDDMAIIKESNNVPSNMVSCHTAIVDGYVVEGHVPVEDINRLIKERPDAVGIAAPGMPANSPGMDIPTDETYEVFLFDITGNSEAYANH